MTGQREGARVAHLVVLWSFAVVQPVLGVLTDSVEHFFPARRVDGALFVAVLVAVVLVPPLLLWGLGLLVGRAGARWRTAAHLVTVAALTAMLVAYVLRETFTLGIPVTVVLVVVAAALGVRAYVRFGSARMLLSVLLPAPALFVVAFLLFTDASGLVFAGDTRARTANPGTDTPVVLLVLDEFPVASIMRSDGEIDRERFPNFARLAREGTWYRNTLGVSWTTFDAVPAILSSRRPDPSRLPVISDHPDNLFTALARSHEQHVIESFTRLCPLAVCPNGAPAVRRALALMSALSLVYVNVVSPRSASVRAPSPGSTWRAILKALRPEEPVDPFDFETADLRLFPGPQFERWMSTLRKPSSGRPPLWFLHSSLPHNPYTHLPSGKLYRDHDKEEPGLDDIADRWNLDTSAVLHGYQRHLLQVQYVDTLIGRAMDRLREIGVYDDAIVVVVADHGASFLAGESRREPARGTDSAIAMVPLFVKAPGQRRGETVDAPVSVLDVLPTIAAHAGIDLPYDVEGLPLDEAARTLDRTFTLLDGKSQGRALDPDALMEERARHLEEREAVFPLGEELYGVGVGRELMGEQAREHVTGELPGADVRLDQAEEVADVDLSSPFVPALISGTLQADREQIHGVAVAVDGVVVGTGGVHGEGERLTYSVMIREDALRDGRNDVRVYGTTGKPGSISLLAPAS